MKDLIERLEKSKGPDRELDGAVYIAVHIPAERAGRIDQIRGCVGWWPKDAPYVSAIEVPAYTSSIDAALTLVPDGAGLQLERYWLRRPEAAWRAVLYLGGVPGNPRRSHVGEDAFTPAIALCIAALKERQHSASPMLPRQGEA